MALDAEYGKFFQGESLMCSILRKTAVVAVVLNRKWPPL